MNFHDLRKNLKNDYSGLPIIKLAIVADWSTQLLVQAIKGYGYEKKINFEIYEAAFNQIEAELYNEESELYLHDPEFILLIPCSRMLEERFFLKEEEDRKKFAETESARIEGWCNHIHRNSKAKILLSNYTEINDMVFGNYGAIYQDSFLYQIRKLNFLISEKMSTSQTAYLVDISSLQNRMGLEAVFDPRIYYLTKTAFKPDFLAMMAEQFVILIQAMIGRGKKCIISDLDQTLWGGIIGDDGMEHIQIGETGIGQAYTDLQRWIKKLVGRGIIFAVCSKNDNDKATEPFMKHPNMVLRMDDIAVFMANWEDKATNLKRIQETLNIGFDSMVFIDDNPFERELVRRMLPEITVPDLPKDPAAYLGYLQGLNLFETVSLSVEDENRTRLYQEEAKRTDLKYQFSNIDDYLRSLNMVGELKTADSFAFSRMAQLSQRSNQFNLRTKRYTEEEILAMANDPDTYIPLYATLEDNMGDYGIISVVIFKKQSEETLFIDTLLMSCRVLKRGMEEFLFNQMVQLAKANGYRRLEGEYIETAKNKMVADLYPRFGFLEKEGIFHLQLEDYQQRRTFVEEKKDGSAACDR